jgi:hypothetical protein
MEVPELRNTGTMAVKSQSGLRLRLWGRRALASWLCVLRTWAERRGSVEPNPGEVGAGCQDFLAENSRRQEELHRVFAPYYRFCPACGSECCREGEIPYSALDQVLYGLTASPVRDRGGKKRGYFSCFQRSYLSRKLKRFTSAGGLGPGPAERSTIAPICPGLTDAGCSLPWGERPSVCVFCACPQILTEMAWPDFGRYAWANLKYLLHLSRALGKARWVSRV